MPRTCVFCGAAKTTNEHAWADWLSDVFPLGTRNTSDRYGRRIAEWKSPRLSLAINRVCARCNNEWMSQLEAETQPILTPLIKGRHRTLWTDHQEILTAWLLKTCMVFEFTADPEREPYYTFAERQGMADDRVIPPQTNVWLGSYLGDKYRGWAQDRDLTLTPDPSGMPTDSPPTSDKAYVNVLAIGHFLAVVISSRRPGSDDAVGGLLLGDETNPLKDEFVAIWPITGIGQWPPPLIFDTAGLENLAGYFG